MTNSGRVLRRCLDDGRSQGGPFRGFGRGREILVIHPQGGALFDIVQRCIELSLPQVFFYFWGNILEVFMAVSRHLK